MAEMPEVWSQPASRIPLLNYQSIDIAKIKPSHYQARKVFDEGSIKALADSIREEGLLEPIVIRQAGEEYELVSGERRLRACMMIGLTAIDARSFKLSARPKPPPKG
jgi:ParB family chromosome partitioning protein